MRNARTLMRMLPWLALWAGCGDDENVAGSPGALTVLVVDQGIDPQLPAFQGKTVAGYTLSCVEQAEDSGFPDPFAGQANPDASASSPDAGASDGGASVDGGGGEGREDLKAAVLKSLMVPDESCRLSPGLDAIGSPLADQEAQRSAWNRKVRTDVDITEDPLLAIADERLADGAFHGTSTAGIIAHDNASVRLVLVNRRFADIGEIASSLGCPEQSEIDLATALLTDPEIRRAATTQPRGQSERALVQAMIDHRVDLVNQSFGPLSRYGFEQLLTAVGCRKALELRPYFAALSDLTADADAYLPTPRALVIRAAGNEGAYLMDSGDGFDCRGARPLFSMVGSYGPTGQKSDFTNFGPCVDVFAPGEAVAAPVPGDWWMPQFGTSFAAPLVVRLLSKIMPHEPFDGAEALRRLHALRRPNNSIPRPEFPEELLYLPGRPSPLALKTSADLPARAPAVSQEQLHRILRPLRWVRQRR